jgi:hypothetical protein
MRLMHCLVLAASCLTAEGGHCCQGLLAPQPVLLLEPRLALLAVLLQLLPLLLLLV